MDIARCMFAVRGCSRGSFIARKSASDRRTEQLWCDVWSRVLDNYYNLLHGLEGDGLLDPRNWTHLFCAQYVFLPRIQADLDTLAEEWNNRSRQTEQNCTPNQLWDTGKAQSPVTPPYNL